MTLPRLTRRSFLAAGAALAAPYVVPGSVLGAAAPSNRITLGCIGTGNQGVNDMRGFLQNEDAQVVAVCDVNTGSYGYKTAEQFLGREPAAPAEVAHRSATLCHLGNIAMILKRKLRWDPDREEFPGTTRRTGCSRAASVRRGTSSIPSQLNLRVPRLRSLQPCIPADDHGCTRRSRGIRVIKVDGILERFKIACIHYPFARRVGRPAAQTRSGSAMATARRPGTVPRLQPETVQEPLDRRPPAV
jgi:hypothetical protein